MSELQVIQAMLEKIARRRRWERAWRGLWLGLLAGAAVWLVGLGAFKLLPLPSLTLAATGGLAVGCLAAGFVIGGWRRSSPAETARWIDARQHLKERLSTALELAPSQTEWSRLLVGDAARHARELDCGRLLPWHLPRAARGVLLLLLAGALLGLAPEHRSQAFLQKQNDAANIRDAGRQLADLTKRNLEHRPPALEPTQKALLSVAELGQQLANSPLARSEALRDLANAAEKLSQQAQELARNPALKPLERAARESGGASASQTPEGLQKQIDALQKSIGTNQATPEGLEKLKARLEQMQQAAAALPDQNSAAGQSAREQMAQSLAALAQQAAAMGEPLENLDAAIKALEKNEISQVLKDLDLAAHDLEKLKDMAKKLAQLQQQAGQLGKDLAEQLANGQADAARQTLAKMIQQLKAAGLTGDQMQKIVQEVAKALDPAGAYGKVADFLKDAVKQMQQAQAGSNPARDQAAQSLAAAAKELEKLSQEMSDLQSLAATLGTLSQAQQAIASGQGWKPCQKCGQCNGQGCAACRGTGWSHGGGTHPGGVGTWAGDQEGWAYYPDQVPQTPVDNSGVQRPDMEGRGLTDRGPGEASEALKPTRVKGKVSPGGPVPSITLKGVSIKGASNVRYEEAAAAAQSEARSALSQDQVPRAYQNAVKDYFDDLKK